MINKNDIILKVENLKTYFRTPEGIVKAVDDISFNVYRGEILAIVGESGCGKSVTVLSIMGLVKCPPASMSGNIIYNNQNLLTLNRKEYKEIRGKKLSMIFQEPMSAFDPLYTIGYQLTEVALANTNWTKEEAREKIIETLKKVNIPAPEKRFEEYPHEMSGGMLQRIMIAMALITSPEIIIADEPTTALDVTIQAQVLNLIRNLQNEYNGSTIFITHDLGVVAELADRVHVMYAGKMIEKANVVELYKNPLHPYTKGLLNSRVMRKYKGGNLPYIKGYVPKATEFPQGCRFNPRCPKKIDKCMKNEPPEYIVEKNHYVSCWLYEGSEINANNKSD